jgi:HAE1 family hydrophobic/amphiphilic exporter-1
MKFYRLGISFLFLALSILPAEAQSRETYHGLLTQKVRSDKLPGPQHLGDYVSEGKLRLSLRDAVLLALENNSEVRIDEAQVETSKFALLGSYKPFDPKLLAMFSADRASYTGFSLTQGVGNSGSSSFTDLTHTGQLTYKQTFQTGTDLSVDLISTRYSSNSDFFFINPYFNTVLTLTLTQPLLRNRGTFANRAPLVIARRAVQQSRANFEMQVSEIILDLVKQYWGVVKAHGNLEVDRKSLEAADASYQRDKRALELGALPPLNIYVSESEVASRRVQMIQGEYALKQAEDTLRLTIGANQDNYFRALDLDLTEKPEPEGELLNIDAATALQEALAQRPEVKMTGYALDNDDTSLRLARNHLQPDLSLAGNYRSYGIGGNQFSFTTGQLISRGGLGSSLSQLFGFGFPGYGASLTLNLPVKNRAAQADMGSALVSRHHDLYLAQQVREQITFEVSDAVHQLELGKLTLAAGRTALDLAQKALAAAQRKYELGVETIFFVLDAQTKLAQAESSLLEAQVNYQVAVALVDHATAGLLQPYHVQIAELSQ